MTAEKKIPPKPGKETIYIDVDDEITGIIDKVEVAKEKVVALVLPKRATSLQSIVNMRLLKRAADNAGKNVVLITAEEALMPLAGAAGLHVARNLQSKPEIPSGPNLINPPASAEPPVSGAVSAATADSDEAAEDEDDLPNKINYDKSIGELAAVHEIEHPETIELGDEEDPIEAAAASTEKLPKAPKKDKALKVPNFDKFRLFMALGIAGLIALIVFIYLAIAVLPRATIAITTTSTPVSANLTLNTSGSAKSYNPDTNIIPGYSEKKDQTAITQVTATGQKNNGNKASGSVTMDAGSCSQPFPSSIPAGTGISSGNLTFITQQAATFTGLPSSGGGCEYQSNSVDVVANQGGSNYNLPAGSSFTVAGYSGVSATNSSDFTGGTDDMQTVVSQSDVENAKQKLTPSNGSDFAKSFESDLSKQGYYVLSSTLKQTDPSVSANPAVGQPASNATVTLKITYTVLAVKQADLKQAITGALNSQIDKSKQKVDDSQILNDASVSVTSQSSPTDAALNITENTSAIPLIDADSIKKLAEGKKSGVIVSSVSQIPGVKSVTVKTSPFWVSKVPNKPSKITVNIKHVNNGG